MRDTPLILIVEDNQASLDIMRARLLANNYDVITAINGLQGLDQAREHLPDLILLDIMMPKMDGLDVCRILRKDATIPFIPIILVTAKTDIMDVVAGLEAGGDEYLTKPVNHTSLVARVKSMLRIKDLHDMVLAQTEQMKRQLETATKVQELFWPKSLGSSDKANIWAFSEPAAYVGGDLYDIIQMSDNSVLVYVADISGKGVAAALIMAALSTMIRSEALFHKDMVDLLKVVNKSMVKLSSDEGYFATMICAKYWPENGRLQLLRAGHPFPLWIVNGTIIKIPWLDGIPLGIMEDVNYETHDIVLSAGDSCLFYSDGVIEAENESEEMFGNKKLIECISKKKAPPWGQMVVDAVQSWRGRAKVNDDTTVLEIRHEQ